jgi:hypothetical protein
LNGPSGTKLRAKHFPFTEITVDYLFRIWITFELAKGASIDTVLTRSIFVRVPQTALLVYHDETQVFVSQNGIFRTGRNAGSFLALTANEKFGLVIPFIANAHPGLVRAARAGMVQGTYYFTYLAFPALFRRKM